MIQSLLVAVDTSATAKVAASYANFLAYKLEATLEAVYVMDSRLINMTYWTDYGAISLPGRTVSKEMEEMLREQGKQLLGQVQENAAKAGVSCRTTLSQGVPAAEILEAAKDCDLVVLGRRGESALVDDRRGLGAVAEQVLRTARQPVLLTAESFEDMRRVVLGYDGSERAGGAMRYAAELAHRLNLPMLALSVHRDEGVARERLDTVASYGEAHGIEVATKPLPGDPADAILAEVEEGDLIAMGAFGEGRIREWLLGSTTEALLRGAVQPVLLHR
jgi:nucleotide-binding universal stress UspA family protein